MPDTSKSDRVTPETRARIIGLSNELACVNAQTFGYAVGVHRQLQSQVQNEDDPILKAYELCSLINLEHICLTSDLVQFDGTPRGPFYARLLILTMRESSRALHKGLSLTLADL